MEYCSSLSSRSDFEDSTMLTPRRVTRLEDLAFEKATASIIGDLVLCDALLYRNPHCAHSHSRILSMLGLNDPDRILKYVRSRIEELPGLVGEKFRERFLEKIARDGPNGLRLSVLYDIMLFEELVDLKFQVPRATKDLAELCDILVKKAPKLRRVETELPKWSNPLENTALLFQTFTLLKDLESLVISTDVGLDRPEHFQILGRGCKRLKQLRFEKVLLNNDCLASLLLANPKKIYYHGNPMSVKKDIHRGLHAHKLKQHQLTPIAHSVEHLYFEYNMPDGIDSKVMSHVLFNLPNLQSIYMDPTHVGSVFGVMFSGLKKMAPIKLSKLRMEGEHLEVLRKIRLVAPNLEALELIDMVDKRRGKNVQPFDRLQTLSVHGAEKSVQKLIFPSMCPKLEVLSCTFIPCDLRDIKALSMLKKLELEPYSSRNAELDVPVNFFERIEAFKSTTGCLGLSFGREIVSRPGRLTNLDIQCLHDITSDKDFQNFCRHGKWESVKIRRCESLTLDRIYDLLRFNPGLKELLVPKSVVPENPMQEFEAKIVAEITKYCNEHQVSLKIDLHDGYRCYFEPYSSGGDLDMRNLFTSFVLDTGNGLYGDSDEDDDDPNFFDMLQRAMVGDYDIDDIYGYGDVYDSDFDY